MLRPIHFMKLILTLGLQTLRFMWGYCINIYLSNMHYRGLIPILLLFSACTSSSESSDDKATTQPIALLDFPSLSMSDTTRVSFESKAEQVLLFELFTSEGCSSCVPAEAWFNVFTSDPQLWEDIVPVAFHVDYWDQLGWTDPFASAAYTERQRSYAATWPRGRVYTPGFVVNGREWKGWFENQPLSFDALTRPGILRATREAETVHIQFTPATPANTVFDVHVALLGFGISVDVKAGENRGRTLSHHFTALGLEKGTLRPTEDQYSAQIPLPNPDQATEKYGLAVWVSEKGNLAPLQAVGGWLPNQ
jgi:hypothetical protein